MAAKLALAMREAIREYRERDGENENAFSVGAHYEDGDFTVSVAFTEDTRKSVLCWRDTNPVVRSLWLGLPEADEELARLAGIMLSEGWVDGYPE